MELRKVLNIDRLDWKLGACIALIVVVTVTAASLLLYRSYYAHLLDVTRQSTSRETWLIRQALEYQMLEKDRGLLRRMVAGFAKQPLVRRVMILDREGQVRYSSDPAIREHHFAPTSATCQVCHSRAPAERGDSTVLELERGTTMRCVQPIENRKACHSCHDPEHRINGVIIVDVPLARTRATIERSVRHLALGTGTLALVLLSAIGLAFRRLVMRRLFRFESAARAIAHGDHAHRVPVGGTDALARVEQQFNDMADAMVSLLGQLREQRASLEKVMNSVDDGMVVLDRSRRIVAANEAFLRRFLRVGGELIGQVCGGGTAARGEFGCGSEGECPTLRCFTSGTVQMAILRRRLADGIERQEEVRSSPVFAADGSISHAVEVWRDITDRRSAEARLADYQRMVSLGMLASGFSHELNTPLGSIGTCLDGIRRQCAGEGDVSAADKDEILDYARIAATQVARCGDITQQFLRLARGKTLAREILDLRSTVEVAARLCEHAARDAAVDVVVEQADEVPAVLANGAAVQQVVMNLVLNAVQASQQHQAVRVSFACSAECVEVRVCDEGRGLGADDLQHVFEPFFTRRGGGSGLGLFVSMNLARGWGGDIVAESEPGRGSRFTILFPPATDDEEGSDGAGEDPGR